jgi:hypothetical protein
MARLFLWVVLTLMVSQASADPMSGTGEAVKRGDTKLDVERKLGFARRQDTTFFDTKCTGLQEAYQYLPRAEGDLAQTVTLCDDRVVDIRYDSFNSETSRKGTGAPVRVGDTRLEVDKKRGQPQRATVELLNPRCDGRYDVYEYAPRTEGDPAETVLLCNNRVVAIKRSR